MKACRFQIFCTSVSTAYLLTKRIFLVGLLPTRHCPQPPSPPSQAECIKVGKSESLLPWHQRLLGNCHFQQEKKRHPLQVHLGVSFRGHAPCREVINIFGDRPWLTVFARLPGSLAVNSKDGDEVKAPASSYTHLFLGLLAVTWSFIDTAWGETKFGFYLNPWEKSLVSSRNKSAQKMKQNNRHYSL